MAEDANRAQATEDTLGSALAILTMLTSGVAVPLMFLERVEEPHVQVEKAKRKVNRAARGMFQSIKNSKVAEKPAHSLAAVAKAASLAQRFKRNKDKSVAASSDAGGDEAEIGSQASTSPSGPQSPERLARFFVPKRGSLYQLGPNAASFQAASLDNAVDHLAEVQQEQGVWPDLVPEEPEQPKESDKARFKRRLSQRRTSHAIIEQAATGTHDDYEC